MWIKTQGGYLLNLDKVEFVNYNDTADVTFANGDKLPHLICEGNIIDNISDNIIRGTKIMEVR